MNVFYFVSKNNYPQGMLENTFLLFSPFYVHEKDRIPPGNEANKLFVRKIIGLFQKWVLHVFYGIILISL